MNRPRFETIPISLAEIAKLREFEREVRDHMEAALIRACLPAHCIIPTDGSRVVVSPDGKVCGLLPPPNRRGDD